MVFNDSLEGYQFLNFQALDNLSKIIKYTYVFHRNRYEMRDFYENPGRILRFLENRKIHLRFSLKSIQNERF